MRYDETRLLLICANRILKITAGTLTSKLMVGHGSFTSNGFQMVIGKTVSNSMFPYAIIGGIEYFTDRNMDLGFRH